jgi:hypothetical protein
VDPDDDVEVDEVLVLADAVAVALNLAPTSPLSPMNPPIAPTTSARFSC